MTKNSNLEERFRGRESGGVKSRIRSMVHLHASTGVIVGVTDIRAISDNITRQANVSDYTQFSNLPKVDNDYRYYIHKKSPIL